MITKTVDLPRDKFGFLIVEGDILRHVICGDYLVLEIDFDLELVELIKRGEVLRCESFDSISSEWVVYTEFI